MHQLAEKEYSVWRLAGASHYKDNHSGTFSPRSSVSQHTFGWDRVQQALVVLDHFGMAGTVARRLPIPFGLAELFLRRCQEVAFAEPFLNSSYPTQDVEETLEFHGHKLVVSCSAAKHRPGLRTTMPSLSLVSGLERLWLFYELRRSFAGNIKTLSLSDIQTNLRPP